MWRRVSAMLFVVAVICGSMARGEDWPAWRGPLGTGISEAERAPVKWSATENVRWKISLAGPGNATPIVWRERVFVSSASEQGRRRGLYCYHRDDGRLLWKQEVEYSKTEVTHDTNPFCSASPVTDGERVVVWHGSAGLFAYDLAGKLAWQRDLGEFQHVWGNASSPVLFENLVILSAGPGLSAFVVAFDKRTGQDVWRLDLPELKSDKVGDFHGSWSTPVITREGNDPIMFLSVPTKLYAVEPRKGTVLWECEGLSRLVYTSPLWTKELVIAMCGYHGPALGVRRGGQGNVTESHRLWLTEKPNLQRVGSGVVIGDYIYILNEPGIFWCIEAKTGQVKWEKRVGKKGSWSSIVHACGRIYALNMDGDAIVIEPDPHECKVIGENAIGETTRASLALSDGRFYLRTYQHLYCIEEPKPRTVSQESIEYLQKLRKNTPFGTTDFNLEQLRAGMGSRREPASKDVRLIRSKIGEIPCEWVVAPGADPDVRLLYLHGGGFVSGSGGFYLTLAAHISAAAKCAVLLPDYRLAPEHRFPAGLDDCVAAHEWILLNGPDGPGASKVTFIAGDSAGGSLTLATLLALRDRRRPLPAGGIPLSPTTDLTLASESLQTVKDPIISARTMPVFRDHYLGQTDPRNPLASPVFGDYRGLPPLLIQVGEHEMLRDDSLRVANKARTDGISVKLEVWPGMFHVFQSHEPLLPEARESIEQIADFMRTEQSKR